MTVPTIEAFHDTQLQQLETAKDLESHEKICSIRYEGIQKSLAHGSVRMAEQDAKLDALDAKLDTKAKELSAEGETRMASLRDHYDKLLQRYVKWGGLLLVANLIATLIGPDSALKLIGKQLGL